MSEKLHVLWTPSWYPTAEHPLNGSFFSEQIQMLRADHMNVGVINLSPQTLWQWRPRQFDLSRSERTLRGLVPTIPLGLAPGDRHILNSAARKAAQFYTNEYGVPDVIHAHSVFPGAVVAHALAKFWTVPFGITEHRPSVVELPRLRWRNHLLRQVLRRADFRLAVSNTFARQLSDAYGCEFSTVTNPVPRHFFNVERQPHEHYTFIHISNLERLKRVEEVIDAFTQIQLQYPHTRLKIVGGQPDTLPTVKAHVAKRGVADLVNMTGPIPRCKMATILSDADCLVLVSQAESAGVVFAEAQSLGIPCIASNTPGGSYMVTPESGMVVPIDDEGALIAAMREMVSRGSEEYPTQEVRQQAWDRFGPDRFAQDHRKIYQNAVLAHQR